MGFCRIKFTGDTSAQPQVLPGLGGRFSGAAKKKWFVSRCMVIYGNASAQGPLENDDVKRGRLRQLKIQRNKTPMLQMPVS